MIVHNEPLSFFVDLIKSGKNFKFLKFGDGEFRCVQGDSFTNGEFEVTPEVTRDYKLILGNLRTEHYNALQPLVLMLPDLVPLVPKFDWYNADVLHNASIDGQLEIFFECLQDRNVVLICNQYMSDMKKYFANCHSQIIIKDSLCYEEKYNVMAQIETFNSDTVFLISASVLSEYLIYHSREDCTFIDTGSVFEPFLNRAIRDYQKNMNLAIIKKNLGRFYIE